MKTLALLLPLLLAGVAFAENPSPPIRVIALGTVQDGGMPQTVPLPWAGGGLERGGQGGGGLLLR